MHSTLFISGTDTGIGKTLITGLLAHFLQETGLSVITQKWVQTGYSENISDIKEHLLLMKKNPEEFTPYMSLMMPYCFQFPGSPHLAAALEKKTIDLAVIESSLTKLKKHFNSIIIEGSGGLFVPINSQKTYIDLIKLFSLPVILVVGNKLGAINQALLSIDALAHRKIPILGLIFNTQSPNESELILNDNPKIIETISEIPILGTLPYSKDINMLSNYFQPIGEKILIQIKKHRIIK